MRVATVHVLISARQVSGLRLLTHTLLSCLGLLLAGTATAQQFLPIHTFAGWGEAGTNSGFGSNARFNSPQAVTVDGTGTVFIADSAQSVIRKATVSAFVDAFAGNTGSTGSEDGVGPAALFSDPQGIAVDTAGNVYVTDTGNATIRKISAAGSVTTVAGSPDEVNSFDGPATSARFLHPQGIAIGPDGNLYVADSWNHTVRRVTPAGIVTTLAGLAGNFGAADGTNSKARFNRPAGIAVDAATNIYVADSLNHVIRKLTSSGAVSTIAGLPGVWGSADGRNREARFCRPQGIAVAGQGELVVADTGNHTLRRIVMQQTDWVVSTIAGDVGSPGFENSETGNARFAFPTGLARDAAGYLFIADAGNHAIRTTKLVAPTLHVSRSGTDCILSWPVSSAGFAVEATSAPGASWSAVSETARIVGDNFTLNLPATSEAAFYRLYKSPL